MGQKVKQEMRHEGTREDVKTDSREVVNKGEIQAGGQADN